MILYVARTKKEFERVCHLLYELDIKWLNRADCGWNIEIEQKAAAPDLLAALEFVQTALADWRDGQNTTYHPEHGELNLEEVKYLVGDTAITKATQ